MADNKRLFTVNGKPFYPLEGTASTWAVTACMTRPR